MKYEYRSARTGRVCCAGDTVGDRKPTALCPACAEQAAAQQEAPGWRDLFDPLDVTPEPYRGGIALRQLQERRAPKTEAQAFEIEWKKRRESALAAEAKELEP